MQSLQSFSQEKGRESQNSSAESQNSTGNVSFLMPFQFRKFSPKDPLSLGRAFLSLTTQYAEDDGVCFVPGPVTILVDFVSELHPDDRIPLALKARLNPIAVAGPHADPCRQTRTCLPSTAHPEPCGRLWVGGPPLPNSYQTSPSSRNRGMLTIDPLSACIWEQWNH